MNVEKNVEDILKEIDPNFPEEILHKTSKRVANAYDEFFDGYSKDNSEVIGSQFDSEMDDIIILKNISFESHCEHHMVPIIGCASVGYIPNKKIVGISKLARIVDYFAHRLQLQERLTMQIAELLQSWIDPLGVAVYIEAEHFCISHRGVKKKDASMITRYFTGKFKSDPAKRNEFLMSIR